MNREELDACIEDWRGVTAATEADITRAQQRIDAVERPAGYDPSELKAHPRPSRGAAARVEARLHARSQPPPAPWGWSAGMAVVMTTAALLLLSIGGPPRPAEDPWADEPAVVEAVAPGLDAHLNPATPELQATEHVALHVEGEGQLSGVPEAPRISWSRGALDVDLEPDQGVDLRVVTAEADVSVLGTRFTVERDAGLGTRVSVRAGRVRVVCRGAEPTEIGDGVEVLCPARAALLGDARRMSRAGDHAGAIDAASRGLRMADGDAVAAELLYVRLESRIAAGATDPARADAQAYLALVPPGPRLATVQQLLDTL